MQLNPSAFAVAFWLVPDAHSQAYSCLNSVFEQSTAFRLPREVNVVRMPSKCCLSKGS